MSEDRIVDYYETLQISPNADADLIARVYRLLAQRFHPDNAETGNAARFREVHQAFIVLSEPESRATYDATYERLKR
jgi:DnaJ-class molecular chaperone